MRREERGIVLSSRWICSFYLCSKIDNKVSDDLSDDDDDDGDDLHND